jgi:PAS domain S-box-containing protein
MDEMTGKTTIPARSPVPAADGIEVKSAALTRHPWWLGYGVAALVTVATIFLRLGLAPWIGDRPMLVLFLIPIIISAYVGGLGPGLVATFLAALGTSYFTMTPTQVFSIARPLDFVQWMILIMSGVLLSGLNEALHRSRKRAEAIAAEHKLVEERLRLMVESAPQGVLIADSNGSITLVNRELERAFGYTREELIGNPIEMLLPAGLRERHVAYRTAFAARPETRAMGAGRDLHGLRKDGVEFPVEVGLVPVRTRQESLVLVSVVDITARKRDEEALTTERSLLRTLIDALPDLVFTKDTAGRFTLCNAAELKHLGFAHEEQLLGKTVFDLYQRELAEIYHADDLQTLGGQPVLNREEPSVDSGGNPRWHLTIKVPLRDRAGAIVGLVGMSRDITDRKRADEAQRRSQKMEALGTLAGGIAHDFNNILLAITGNTRLALGDLPDQHPAQESLLEIDKASARAADLVQRILAFSRQQEIKRKVVQLQPVVEEALKLIRPTLSAMIEIKASFAANVPEVAADSSQIHQLIMNLATNSAHAIAAGTGLIEISLDAPTVTADLARTSADLREGRYARLSVSDNGCGMDKATLERIFDPFFTTKPAGQGTGLGLSTVDGIMRSHEGAVTVYSQPGKGTRFHLYFPAIGDAATEVEAPSQEVARGKGENVLYVDDEDVLVRLSTRTLNRLGYRVSGFASPVEALNAFRSHPHDFDVVVTDLSMPVMSGFDLARALLEIRPDVPIVMTSGYVRPEDQEMAFRLGIRDLILKPNTVSELGRILDELLGDRKKAGESGAAT